MLQSSTSLGFDCCRFLQWLGGPMAQTTCLLRVPELQLLEHWGQWGLGVGETDLRLGHPKEEGRGRWPTTHVTSLTVHVYPPAQGASLTAIWRKRGQALTKPQALTRQAWSLWRGQAACTQVSMKGGRSSKEHAEAGSIDPSSPWQVTLRLRMPAPQVTEHCKSQLSTQAAPSPEEPPRGQQRPTSLARRAECTLLLRPAPKP